MSRAHAGLITVVLALAAALPAQAAGADIGSPGLGDPFFPLAGNGGYDVGALRPGARLRPRDGQARRDGGHPRPRDAVLSRFDLDLRGFDVTRLLVDGQPASYRRDGQELIVTPRPGAADGRRLHRRSCATPACRR